jgi:tetratricopeptide (TPR) repeat protein
MTATADLSAGAADALMDDMGFDSAVLGRGLPTEVEALIRQAGLVRQDRAQAEPLLMRARELAPEHPATLIALYRFHFYGHRLKEAREVATEALRIARAALLPGVADPEATPLPPLGDERARFDAAVRFYLFTLKGYAYLCLRLGDIETGRKALVELRELDPQDRVGGAVLSVVLARAEQGEDDDELDLGFDDRARSEGRMPHRGWGQS